LCPPCCKTVCERCAADGCFDYSVKIRMVGDNVGECVARDTALKKKKKGEKVPRAKVSCIVNKEWQCSLNALGNWSGFIFVAPDTATKTQRNGLSVQIANLTLDLLCQSLLEIGLTMTSSRPFQFCSSFQFFSLKKKGR